MWRAVSFTVVELILRGFTRHMPQHADLPLFMVH
jgi:hypothetical protein